MTPNAFIGKTEKPASAEITKALGPSAEIWKQLVVRFLSFRRRDQPYFSEMHFHSSDWLAREQGVVLVPRGLYPW
jgi:hypothetical protein